MSRGDAVYQTAKWRTLGLALGFAVLAGVGIVTVLLPELADEPDAEEQSSSATSEDLESDTHLQE
jgi:hypothetical protein